MRDSAFQDDAELRDVKAAPGKKADGKAGSDPRTLSLNEATRFPIDVRVDDTTIRMRKRVGAIVLDCSGGIGNQVVYFLS